MYPDLCVVLDINQCFFFLQKETWQLLWSVKQLFWLSVFQSFSLIILLCVYHSICLKAFPFLLFCPLEWQLAGASRLLYTEIIGQKVLFRPVYLQRNEWQTVAVQWTFVHTILEWKDNYPMIKTIEGRNRNGGVEQYIKLWLEKQCAEWEHVRDNESPATSPRSHHAAVCESPIGKMTNE